MNDPIRFLTDARDVFPYTQELRRDFHRHPELGFQEVRTAGVVARELEKLGLEVHTGIADTGVIALIEGSAPGPVVMLRFDMDALPVLEQTGAEYASTTPGIMHACGHDGHIAVGLSIARLLTGLQKEFNGSVKLVFQPAEEGLGGADRMILEGILENPKPDYALGLHIWNDKPLGWIGISPGPVMAASEIFKVNIIGKGGHAGLPHLAVDPLVAASQIVTSLQTIVSREVSPLESAVVSITMLHGGDAFNVIPSMASFQGTIRTFEPSVRQIVLERFEQVIIGIAEAYRCDASVDMQPLTGAVHNDPFVTSKVLKAAEILFRDADIEKEFRTMGSEDMASFLAKIPGCYYFIGSANPSQGLDAPHHHPAFDFDEQVLPCAVSLMTAATINLLSNQG